MSPASPMAGHFDPAFVLISFLIAILSAYAALDLTGRVASSRTRSARLSWIGGGAGAMGIGIWSMHYVGMIAFRMPMPVLYDWPTVLLSMLAAITASGVALSIATRKRIGPAAAVLGSLTMGGGIATMHYVGMSAMRMAARPVFSTPLVALSVALAVIISFVALLVTFASRHVSKTWTWRKGLSALLLGLAIPVMHYTGMAAENWVPSPLNPRDLGHAVSISDLGASCVALVSLVILCLVFFAAVIDRRFSDRARQMQDSEERYRRIIASAFDAFIGLTPDGRITDWNTQARITFGWTGEEVAGRCVEEILLAAEPLSGVAKQASEDPAAGRILPEGRTEMMARHKTGLTFPVEVAVSTVQIGERRQLAAFVHDVSGRKAAETQMEEARASAEAASRAKSEFLANMSHEIRTPLNGVIGMTDLALETELTREQREYIETVKLSADSLLGVINDILDFSKIEAGKVELETTAFDLRECIESTLKTLALRADEKCLELLCDIAADIPEAICGDPGRLRQILTNLVGNALKFTDEGEVSITVAAEHQGANAMLRFTVSDTGIGIAPDKVDRIFESFNQADTSTTRQYGGTGLGLTISRRLVELMTGRIWVESELGRGSQFHFAIPLQEAPSRSLPLGEAAPKELTGVKVLIVDDNKTNRRILEGLLTRWGMRVASAAGGVEAVRMVDEAIRSEHPFRLILTDMHMPKMDGFMVVEELQRGTGVSTATVMMLSSGGHRGDAERCQELGIAAYLLKPVRQTELQAAIARALGAGPAHDEHMITQQTLQAERPANEFLDILLAEDNEVNQRLAMRLLEKRGHNVTIVGNGRRAVQALASRSFDLVLMDVQMPEMDGIEATVEIRRRERGSRSHQPIVAMTALVMKGDRERCMDAEMDGYLSKPIRPRELDEVLETYTRRKRVAPAEHRRPAPAVSETIDVTDLLTRVDDDLVFVAELTEVLREDCLEKLRSLRLALEQDDTVALKLTAHGLKGALGNLSATRAAHVAAQIERLSAASELKEVPSLLEELEIESANAIEALTAMCGEPVL